MDTSVTIASHYVTIDKLRFNSIVIMILLLIQLVFAANIVSVVDDLTDTEKYILSQDDTKIFDNVIQSHRDWFVFWKLLTGRLDGEHKWGRDLLADNDISDTDDMDDYEDDDDSISLLVPEIVYENGRNFVVHKSDIKNIVKKYLWQSRRKRSLEGLLADMDDSIIKTIDDILAKGLSDAHVNFNLPPSSTPSPAIRSNTTVAVANRLYTHYGHCRKFKAFSDETFLMVDKCPLNTRDVEIFNLCTGSHSLLSSHSDCEIDVALIPVQDNNGVLYKNIYCAFCHGANNISSWSAEINTNDLSQIIMDYGNKKINLLQNLETFSECNSHIYPSDVSKIRPCSKNDAYQHRGRVRHKSIDDSEIKTSVFPISFQVLMNFGITGKGHIFFTATPSNQQMSDPTCPENQIYDSSKKTCRRIICETGYQLHNSKCVPIAGQNGVKSVKHLDSDNEMSQITLRINVSESTIFLFKQDGIEQIMTQELASLLNITQDRILNFTLDVMNGTSPEKMVEINKLQLTENPNLRKANLGSENEFDTEVDHNAPSQVKALSPEESLYNATVDNTIQSLFATERIFTLVIRFFILPSRKKFMETVDTSDVINAMKSLINGKAFTFSLNGTNFQVEEIQNDQDALVIQAWCTRGQIDFALGDQIELINNYYDAKTGLNVSGVYVNETDSFYKLGMYDLYVMFSSNLDEKPENISLVSYVFVCDMPRIVNKSCGRVEIGENEYTWFSNNSILYGDILLDMNEYEYTNESYTTIKVCIPDSFGAIRIQKSSILSCKENFISVIKSESYLSLILGLTSIFAMIAVLVTYMIFPELRNLPGVNTMNLTISLCLGELIFISSGIAISNCLDWLCKTYGVLLHYLFLASFFWMNVMSYDLFKTFANKCLLTRIREKKKYFKLYCLYAWGMPGIIVLCCSVVDFGKIIPDFSIGYGTKPSLSCSIINNRGRNSSSFDGCWISEPVAALTTFGIPIILILLLNGIMFAITISHISATARSTKMKTRRSSINRLAGKNDVLLYVRMSTVMGFTWIIGLASSIISAFLEFPSDTACIVIHVFSILFDILNCSQGLFIFFAFVFNRRVFSLYRNKINNLSIYRKKKYQEPRIPSISAISHP